MRTMLLHSVQPIFNLLPVIPLRAILKSQTDLDHSFILQIWLQKLSFTNLVAET